MDKFTELEDTLTDVLDIEPVVTKTLEIKNRDENLKLANTPGSDLRRISQELGVSITPGLLKHGNVNIFQMQNVYFTQVVLGVNKALRMVNELRQQEEILDIDDLNTVCQCAVDERRSLKSFVNEIKSKFCIAAMNKYSTKKEAAEAIGVRADYFRKVLKKYNTETKEVLVV